MIKIMRFFPALIFLFIWVLIVSRGIEMKKAIQVPVTSDQFITTIGRDIDNPWTHNSALRIFFIRLRQVGAPARIWTDSQPFGWELWNEYQSVGGIEIMLLIAHASGNRLEEQYWAKKYAALEPNIAQAQRLIKQLRSSSAVPLELLSPW